MSVSHRMGITQSPEAEDGSGQLKLCPGYRGQDLKPQGVKRRPPEKQLKFLAAAL